MTAAESYWNNYISKNPQKKDLPYGGECRFGDDAETCCELLALVLTGKKTASCSALEAFKLDCEKLPVAGLCYVLTDIDGNPKGIIQTVKVDILPYNAVTWEMAQKEGDVGTMQDWVESRNEYFMDESDFMGYEFKPDMPVVFEQFVLLIHDI
ncbi:MAG: ASCH domain-containing protein [Spirochaetaceae bacterium]|nr:ASCH domain-containing protein [Spirochaetaceae bacterium]MBP5329619.1 ASCH domain-containing protein [Spirochaetaceae bacterium]